MESVVTQSMMGFLIILFVGAITLSYLLKQNNMVRSPAFSVAVTFGALVIFFIISYVFQFVIPRLFYLWDAIGLYVGCLLIVHFIINLDASCRKKLIPIWFFVLYLTDIGLWLIHFGFNSFFK